MNEIVNEKSELINSFEKTDSFKFGLGKDIKRTLENCTLGFSNLGSFNDPFESSFRYIYRFKNEEDRKNYYSEFLNNNNHVNKIKKQISDELKKYSVSCFSNTPNEPLMWAHYSDSHQGVCYCFDKNKIFAKNNYSFRNVRYSNLFPDINIYDGKLSFAQIEPQIEEIILTKSNNWRYEQEFRFYIKSTDRIHKFNPESLQCVILGNRTSKEKEQETFDLVKEYNAVNNTKVKVLFATTSMYDYKMVIGNSRHKSQPTTCPLYDSTLPIIS